MRGATIARFLSFHAMPWFDVMWVMSSRWPGTVSTTHPRWRARTSGSQMGTGTDIAMESAALTLVKGDLNGILRARRLSHATLRNIRQNLFFAFAYDTLGIPVAAGLLYPWAGILLSPMLASAAMSLSSVSVIVNALRLGTLRL